MVAGSRPRLIMRLGRKRLRKREGKTTGGHQLGGGITMTTINCINRFKVWVQPTHQGWLFKPYPVGEWHTCGHSVRYYLLPKSSTDSVFVPSRFSIIGTTRIERDPPTLFTDQFALNAFNLFSGKRQGFFPAGWLCRHWLINSIAASWAS